MSPQAWAGIIGWFQVGWTEGLSIEVVTHLRFFGIDLVAWRDEEGTPVVADAHCPHMGAHLGFGGHVVDGCARCPLHGWSWGADGRNVAIPFSTATSTRRLRIRSTAEFRGALFVWHDPLDRPPWYQPSDELPPPRSEDPHVFLHGGFPSAARSYSSVPIHPLLAIEDRVDVDHFAGPHAIEPPELVELEFREQAFSSVVVLARGGHEPGTRIESHAVGIGVTFLSIAFGTQTTDILLSVTPNDEGVSDVLHTVWCRSDSSDVGAAEDELAWIVPTMRGELEQDLMVWSHLRPSAEIPSEHFRSAESLIAVRAWAERFFVCEVDPLSDDG